MESINKKLIIEYSRSVFLSLTINNIILILNNIILTFNYIKQINKLLIPRLLNLLKLNSNLKSSSGIGGTGVKN